MLQRERRANCERYQELRRKANGICKKKKMEKMRKQLEEVNKLKIRMSDGNFIRQQIT
jgi:hypothetical protein